MAHSRAGGREAASTPAINPPMDSSGDASGQSVGGQGGVSDQSKRSRGLYGVAEAITTPSGIVQINRNSKLARRDVRAKVWDACGGRCHYCGAAMNPFRDFTIDHATAIVSGGSDEIDNLMGCCATCNKAKGAALSPYSLQGRSDDESDEHYRLLDESKALAYLNIRHPDSGRMYYHRSEVEEAIRAANIEVFRLHPGGHHRVWKRDIPRIIEHLPAPTTEEQP